MKPTVGRIVHYAPGGPDPDSGPWAAIVTRTHADGTVDLMTFAPAGPPHHLTKVAFSDVARVFHWTWPPREVGAGELPAGSAK